MALAPRSPRARAAGSRTLWALALCALLSLPVAEAGADAGSAKPGDPGPPAPTGGAPTPPVIRTHDLTVTATRSEHDVLEIPGQVTVLDRESIAPATPPVGPVRGDRAIDSRSTMGGFVHDTIVVLLDTHVEFVTLRHADERRRAPSGCSHPSRSAADLERVGATDGTSVASRQLPAAADGCRDRRCAHRIRCPPQHVHGRCLGLNTGRGRCPAIRCCSPISSST